MKQQCRVCDSQVRVQEVSSEGGAMLFLPLTPEFEATLDHDGSEPHWLCRFVDACACGWIQDLSVKLKLIQ